MSEHTKGPWSAKNWRVCANVEPGDPPIVVICDTATNKATRNEENAANARLIAAAPDLLAACKAALDNLEEVPGHARQWACDPLEAAIAKAEGRTE